MRREADLSKPGASDSPAAARGARRAAVLPGLALCLSLGLTLFPAVAAAPGLGGEEPITAVAAPRALDEAKVELGRKLFHDPRLSGDGSLACASCHDLARGGDDGHARGRGSNGRLLDFNAPTVFNAALNFRFNWRGNFRRLEAQNEAALLDPGLMAATWEALVPKLETDPGYARGFAAAYGGPPRRETVLDALATFQRSLVTPGARFDRYLAGRRDALTPDERRGYGLFKAYGCTSCHQGRNIGGNLFQRFGVFADPADLDTGAEADLGRFTITGLEADRHVFRVPSLRNVAVTAPYLHDGRAATLGEAVAVMGRWQLGIDLSRRDIDLIVGFLRTLTGEYRGRRLPIAGARTP